MIQIRLDPVPRRRRPRGVFDVVVAVVAAMVLVGVVAGCAGMEGRVRVGSDPDEKPSPDFAESQKW
ncbi:MAG: hypothetical protein NTW19_13550 [Planctomycetota bacterium]|nr:hypothetical protein [Planctomycetota bacterium]